jgi:hypothetical protein
MLFEEALQVTNYVMRKSLPGWRRHEPPAADGQLFNGGSNNLEQKNVSLLAEHKARGE